MVVGQRHENHESMVDSQFAFMSGPNLHIELIN